MQSEVEASTSGIEIATTMPVRKPKLMRLTISTIAIASATASTKSSTECATACGMLETSTSSRPAGSERRSSAALRSSALPSVMTSPDGAMVTPMPSTFCPSNRMYSVGGSV